MSFFKILLHVYKFIFSALFASEFESSFVYIFCLCVIAFNISDVIQFFILCLSI